MATLNFSSPLEQIFPIREDPILEGMSSREANRKSSGANSFLYRLTTIEMDDLQ